MPELTDIDEQPRTKEGPKPVPPKPADKKEEDDTAARAAAATAAANESETTAQEANEEAAKNAAPVPAKAPPINITGGGTDAAEDRNKAQQAAEQRAAQQREDALKESDSARVVGVNPPKPAPKGATAKPSAVPSSATAKPSPAPTKAQMQGKQALEDLQDLVPLYGTYRQGSRLKGNWDDMSNLDRAINTGATTLSAVGDVTLVAGSASLALKAVKVEGTGATKVVQSLSESDPDALAGYGRTMAKNGKPVDTVVIRGATSDTEIERGAKMAQTVADDPAFAKSKLRIEGSATPDGLKGITAVDDALPKGVKPRAVLNVESNLPQDEAEYLAQQAKDAGINRITVHSDVRPALTDKEMRDIAAKQAANNNPIPNVQGPNESRTDFFERVNKARANRAADTAKIYDDLKAGKGVAGLEDPKAIQDSSKRLAKALEGKGILVDVEEQKLAKGGKLPKNADVKELVLEPPAPKGTPGASRGGGVGTLPRTGEGGGVSTGSRTTRAAKTGGKLTVAVAGRVLFDADDPQGVRYSEWTKPDEPNQTKPADETGTKPTTTTETPKPDEGTSGETDTKPKEGAKPRGGHEVFDEPIIRPGEGAKPKGGHEVTLTDSPDTGPGEGAKPKGGHEEKIDEPPPEKKEDTVTKPKGGHEVSLEPIPTTGTDTETTPSTSTETTPKPKTSTFTRTSLTAREATATSASRPVTFRVPGSALKEGEYPRVVGWPQGFYDYHHDLDTGEQWTTKRRRDFTATPKLRVERTDNTPPKPQRFRMGVMDVVVTDREIRYARNEYAGTPPRDRRLRNNPFRRRGL